jgi:RNase H-like domain found in reverse transcriptase
MQETTRLVWFWDSKMIRYLIQYIMWAKSLMRLKWIIQQPRTIFAINKFRSYLVSFKVIIYTNHAAVRYMLAKKDAKSRLIRWILLLQEFDLEMKDKKDKGNLVANYLTRLHLWLGWKWIANWWLIHWWIVSPSQHQCRALVWWSS